MRAVARVADLPDAWDRLDHGASPFLRRGFLAALEASGSIDPAGSAGRGSAAEGQRGLIDPAGSAGRGSAAEGQRGLVDPAGNKAKRGSGWNSVYLLAEQAGELVGGVPTFIKEHSYGEYIFDWGWANAAQRAGLRYYPKLVIAAPATPATGKRILLAPGADPVVADALIAATRALADDTGCSSIHWLFCTREEMELLATREHSPRVTHQFHWHNRGYGTFDDFLGALKSRKRKQLRKERAKARAQIDAINWIEGKDLDETRLDDLDRFYRNTTDNHGGRDYLRPGFFHALAKTLPDAMRMVEVVKDGRRIAGALFLETDQALYGRYWGADAHVDLLHFETAYYAGIERAIEKKLPLFEAGAQGEHKLVRGFEPAPTYSAHWIRHAGLRAAIAEHNEEEARAMAVELAAMAAYGPYRDDSGDPDDDAG